MKSLLVSILATLAFASCGGEQLGIYSGGGPSDEGGGVESGGGSGDSGTISEAGFVSDSSVVDETGSVPDASMTQPDAPMTQPDTGVTGMRCKPGTSSGTGGPGGSCSTSLRETCVDGTTYEATCECPAAICSCSFSMGSSGGGGGGMPYAGCSSDCSDPNRAWEACGFPH